MSEKEVTFNELVKKVNHQEEIITQLIKIVAATNHRISEIMSKEEAVHKSKIIN